MNSSTLNDAFSPQRLFFLVRNLVLKDLPALGIGIGALLGLNVLSLFFSGTAFFNYTDDSLWIISAFGGSMILASLAFKEMNDGKTGTDWLLLPATSLEKYAAAFVMYILFVPAFLFLDSWALSAILQAAERLSGGNGGIAFNPLKYVSYYGIQSLFVTLIVCLAGSARYRKLALIKTGATVIGYWILVTMVFLFVIWTLKSFGLFHLSPDTNVEVSRNFMDFNLDLKDTPLPDWMKKAGEILSQIVFVYGTAVAGILYGVFTVREKEARDEVQ